MLSEASSEPDRMSGSVFDVAGSVASIRTNMDTNTLISPEEEKEAEIQIGLRQAVKMAVMKSCCGCMSTRTGTMTVLMVYAVIYIASIVFSGIQLSDPELENTINAEFEKDENNCMTGDHKDSWWCIWITDMRTGSGIQTSLILEIVICTIFLVTAVLGIYGTSQSKHWFLFPWIVLEFIFLALGAALLVIAMIMMSVYMPEDADSSAIIALGVIAAAFMAFLFYVWLCVVSHFQILREVSKLGLDNLDNVKPFHNEYDDSMLFAAAAAPGMDDDSMGYHPEQDQDALESVDDEQVIDNDPDSAEMTDVASENANNDDNDNDNDKDSDKGNDSDGGDQS